MSIELTDYERGAPFSGDADAAFEALRDRLSHAQLLQLAHKQRFILVIEGPEGAGKAALLRQIATALDARFFSVCNVVDDRRRQSEGHWLARFWAALPDAGETTIYFHSWYRRVLEDRIAGLVAEKDWRRAYDEINEFEAQQRDYGTLLVKLFLHATDAVQERRVEERLADPLQSVLLGPAELREPEARKAYRQGLSQMFEQNHTRWSPWVMVDANDDQAGLVSALTAVVEAVEKAVPGLAAGDSVASLVVTNG